MDKSVWDCAENRFNQYTQVNKFKRPWFYNRNLKNEHATILR